ncbi:hypothetical protein JTB14_032534 [Gonioctena quinquepunctata]|nr:hypothetical protein JTB14_032534 [Gonioctena quinquepunctata]
MFASTDSECLSSVSDSPYDILEKMLFLSLTLEKPTARGWVHHDIEAFFFICFPSSSIFSKMASPRQISNQIGSALAVEGNKSRFKLLENSESDPKYEKH